MGGSSWRGVGGSWRMSSGDWGWVVARLVRVVATTSLAWRSMMVRMIRWRRVSAGALGKAFRIWVLAWDQISRFLVSWVSERRPDWMPSSEVVAVVGDFVGEVGDLGLKAGVGGVELVVWGWGVAGGVMFGEAFADFPCEVEAGGSWGVCVRGVR